MLSSIGYVVFGLKWFYIFIIHIFVILYNYFGWEQTEANKTKSSYYKLYKMLIGHGFEWILKTTPKGFEPSLLTEVT